MYLRRSGQAHRVKVEQKWRAWAAQSFEFRCTLGPGFVLNMHANKCHFASSSLTRVLVRQEVAIPLLFFNRDGSGSATRVTYDHSDTRQAVTLLEKWHLSPCESQTHTAVPTGQCVRHAVSLPKTSRSRTCSVTASAGDLLARSVVRRTESGRFRTPTG